jgi:hypothetical protein
MRDKHDCGRAWLRTWPVPGSILRWRAIVARHVGARTPRPPRLGAIPRLRRRAADGHDMLEWIAAQP